MTAVSWIDFLGSDTRSLCIPPLLLSRLRTFVYRVHSLNYDLPRSVTFDSLLGFHSLISRQIVLYFHALYSSTKRRSGRFVHYTTRMGYQLIRRRLIIIILSARFPGTEHVLAVQTGVSGAVEVVASFSRRYCQQTVGKVFCHLSHGIPRQSVALVVLVAQECDGKFCIEYKCT